MKILKLRFKNINSLAGEFEIDFTNPQYNAEGLFLISGPTGTGKSSILDAICVALYGKTPRIPSITASTNEVMSLGTTDCFSEVEFEVSGTKYRSTFSQSRNRKGELAAPKYLLEDLTQGKVICQQKKEWDKKINSISGMDYDRFVQSVLLAQGEFKKFLEANPNERATLLEKITGGEIYTLISKAVFERNKLEQQKLDMLKQEASLIKTLSDEEKQECEETIRECEKKKKVIDKQEKELQKAAQWLNACSTAETELRQLHDNLKMIQNKHQGFSSRRELLQSALTAKKYEKAYTTIDEREQRLQSITDECDRAVIELKELRTKHTALSLQSDEAEEFVRESTIALEKLSEILPRINDLDAELKSVKKQTADAEGELEKTKNLINEQNSTLRTVQDKIGEYETKIAEIIHYKTENESDGLIGSELSLIQEKADIARKVSGHLNKLKVSLDNLTSEISVIRKSNPEDAALYNELQQIISDADIYFSQRTEQGASDQDITSLMKKKDTLGALVMTAGKGKVLCNELDEVHSDIGKIEYELTLLKEALHDIDQKNHESEEKLEHEERIVNLLSEKTKYIEIRKALLPDAECPVCGSTHHPYTEFEVVSDTDELSRLHEAEENCKKLKESIQKNNILQASIESECTGKENELKKLRAKAGDIQIALTKVMHELSLPHADAVLKAFVDIEATFSQEIQSVTEEIGKLQNDQTQRGSAQNAKIQLAEYEKRLSEFTHKLEIKQAEKDKLQSDIAVKDKELNELSHRLSELGARLRFDSTSVINDDSGIDSLRKRAVMWDEQSREHTISLQELGKLQKSEESMVSRAEELNGQLSELEAELKKMEAVFSTLAEERAELFGDKNPERERKLLGEELDSRRNKFQELSNALSKLAGSIIEKETQAKKLQQEKQKLTSEITKLIAQFEEKIRKEGIRDIDQYRTLLLPDEELQFLQAEAKTLDDQLSSAEERVKSKLEETEKLKEQKLTEQTISIIEESLQKLREEAENAIATATLQEQRLKDDEKNCALVAEKVQLADAQSLVLGKWSKLNELIGQATGDKFRKIAQGMIFDRLLVFANKSLHQIMKRYELKKSGAEGLDISVIDYDNAGSVRPVKNLSGGESFIVSLALALGLSNMASSRVRIDSLFLDEGFGTLDDDVLETALTTLSDLRAGGKLIGIISHIDKIKERIPVKLEVRRVREGVSTISGPGVKVC